MYELKSGDKNNQRIIDFLKVNKTVYEELKPVTFESLQNIIDNYEKDGVDNSDLVEVAITIADELYGDKITQEIANNMWFQWCVNFYNDDDFRIKSFQIAEDLYRRTKNDYRKILNSLEKETISTMNDYSNFYNTIDNTHISFVIFTNRIKIDNKYYYMINRDKDALLKVTIGDTEYNDKIPIDKLFLGMALNDANNSSLGFLKKDPHNFFQKIDIISFGEGILQSIWNRAKSLDIKDFEQAIQMDNTTTTIVFTYEENAEDAVENGVCTFNERIKDGCVVDYRPKGEYFVRHLSENGNEILVPMFRS